MTVNQQISPSIVRQYRISKYNQSTKKMLLEAKKAKRVTSQFMSKQGARAAARKIRELKKNTKEGKKLWDKLLEKIPGKDKMAKAAKGAAGFVQIIYMGGMVVALINKILVDNQIQDIGILNEIRNESEFQKAFQRYQRNVLDIRSLNKRFEAQRKIVERNDKDLNAISKDFFAVKTQAREGRKLANDALYEVRQNRKILEERITRLTPNTGAIQKQVNDIISRIRADFQRQLERITSDLNAQVRQQSRVQPATKQEVEKLTADVKQITSTITNQAESIRRTFVSTQNTIKQVVDTAVAPIARVSAQWGVTVTPATITPATVTPAQTGGVTITPATITPATVTPARFSASPIGGELRVTIRDEVGKVERQVNILGDSVTVVAGVAQQAVQIANTALREGQRRVLDPRVDNLSERIRQQESQINDQKRQLQQQETQIREQERLNQEGNNKLDILLRTIPQLDGKLNSIIPTIAGIPLIAGRVIDGIRPSIPTLPQIENATGTAMCRNLRTGCGRQAIDDAVGRVNNNNNQNTGATLDRLNAALNGLDLAQNTAMLNTINNKLGDQLPGGIGGKLERVSKWLHLDRALNILIWWQTLHNAYMLSANLGQTLTSAISNVLAAIGIKDAEGSPLDIGEILGNQFDNLAKTVIGESEWGAIKAEYKRWNRIYQAAANLRNTITSISQSILGALEIVGGWVALIGNALKKWGKVSDAAYRWMNPQPNFQNRFFTVLENAEDVISQIDAVASEVIDVQENIAQIATQKDELFRALGQQENARQGTVPPEAAQIKAAADASKIVSANGIAIRDEDKEADE